MTANGSRVSEGASLQGSQVVRVYLRDEITPSYSLWFEGVQYTPLYHGEDYDEFIIGDNGEVTILDGGHPYVTFSVEGINVPSELPMNINIGIDKTTDIRFVEGQYTELVRFRQVNCANYNHFSNDVYPYFIIQFEINADLGNRLSFYNCQVNAQQLYSGSYRLNVSVSENDKPAYITLDGFIIAVFNYTN